MAETVYFQGNPVRVADSLPQPGDTAPDFSLVAKDLLDITLNNHTGKRKLLNIFPSIDTAICAATVRRFNQIAVDLENTVVLCISADLPFAQSRFCGTEGLHRVITLSTLRDRQFMRRYGVEITDGPLKGLTARAVMVLDERNKVLYSQRVAEITHEPDYDRALSVLREAPARN
ncbi:MULTISPECIES: thiol peroxidase [Sodalis]|uniref:Thiol peroxidase n=1 Tax=Sodalis ligni TaxID=2697027 RepID=A0A4R1NED8_9GAMM|nr:thiol peroxidase [Sodalis ligni]TCL02510.1 thiol peroxidase (atypical 2-Cys peroxiredoxin) [Sodalis ligni]